MLIPVIVAVIMFAIGMWLIEFIPAWITITIVLIYLWSKITEGKGNLIQALKTMKTEDLMSYPYYSRTTVNYYKAVSESTPVADKWQKSLKHAFERKSNGMNNPVKLTDDEYNYLKEWADEYAETQDYQRAYREMITENLAILNGKKTFAQVEENEIDVDVFSARWMEQSEKILKTEMKEKKWIYKNQA